MAARHSPLHDMTHPINRPLDAASRGTGGMGASFRRSIHLPSVMQCGERLHGAAPGFAGSPRKWAFCGT
jgi:hypothetical protein